MAERPLLILPSPGQPVVRSTKPLGGGAIGLPSRARQAERIEQKFHTLKNAFESQKTRLQIEDAGIIPEQVLVIETIGSIEDFIVAVQKIDGMEWLCEIEEEDILPDDDFFALDSKKQPRPEKKLRGRAFFVFSNQKALDQMLSLWQMWQRNEPLPRGLKKWDQVFFHLRDIHPWGIQERLLDTGLIDDWRERARHEEEIFPCEIELWFRRDSNSRTISRSRVVDIVIGQQGRVLQEAIIEEIAYHGLLVEIPLMAVSQIIEGTLDSVALVQCEQIQFFRATGQMAAILPGEERISDQTQIPEQGINLGDPVIALLDGLPLQNHRRLVDRLRIDDPDDIESQYQAQERKHGTAMASLILHGDLDAQEQPLKRLLYVRPILQPHPQDWRRTREETVPENTLIVDLIHRAVRRIFEGEGDEEASAPSICIINLSIGIKDRLFYGALSPLARLLDWLAWEYQVLFIVSAGNHINPLNFGITWNDFQALPPKERQTFIIRSIAADARNRRLLSPAEAINVLTVGALHEDQSGNVNNPRAVNPYVDQSLPSLINAQGMGFLRSIKPELLAPGGKILLTEPFLVDPNLTCNIYSQTLPPGQKVAAPGSTPGETGATWYIRGTSNATALTSRAAGILYDVLEELRGEPGGDLIETVPMSVWLKVLLTHAADWGRAGNILKDILRSPDNSRQFKEYVTRILGYGAIHPYRVRECAEHRVTALSGGMLRKDQAHVHRFPLPPSLSGIHCWRRLTVTLAWFTPVNPKHRKWRRAALWFEPPKDILDINRQQAEWRAVKRSTVQHEVLEGEAASVFVEDDNLEIKVNCTADAGVLENNIPYALATTLEVKEEIGIPIFDEIKIRIHAARVQVTTP